MFFRFAIINQKLHLALGLILAHSLFLPITSVSVAETKGKNRPNKQLKISKISSQNINHRHLLASETITATKLQVLPATINLVKQHEGFRPYAYLDTSGLPVIGYGQTRINGKTVQIGQYITQAQADTALEQELHYIQSLVLASVQVNLTPHQLGALTSLVYNAGTRVIKNSTLIRKLNAGDYLGAAQEFPRWNKANQGGKLVVFPGLTKRRLEEQKLFLTPPTAISSYK